jgi:hypothetical protein
MAAKVIDVSVATIRNTGSPRVSREGLIIGRIVRAVDWPYPRLHIPQ